ncbi:MAG: nucleotide exchange factor GrpE [Lentisphaeria bacterium]|jgi:molecular chaperone GrpE|nr:nucleotide exchange factor GrpE [Lentisphaeria bacterium]
MKKKANPNPPAEEATNGSSQPPAAEPEAAATAEPGDTAPDYPALCEELKDKLLRHHAEFDNYRKRTQREFAAIREQAKAATIEEFLTVYDHFGMALAHADEQSSMLRQGMDMILAEFRRTFENLGVEEMAVVGQPFDPNLHEAVAQEPSETVSEGHVLRQWKAGFRIGDKLLRPAAVIVSAGPAPKPANQTSEN